MSPIERYRDGQLVEYKSWVPMAALGSATAMGLAIAFFGVGVGGVGEGRQSIPTPEVGGAAPTAFADDGFETGDLSAVGDSFAWGPAGGNVAVTSDNPRTGTYSLRFTFNGSASGGDASAEQRWTMDQRDEVWIEMYMYFPDGTEGLGTAAYAHRNDSPSNNKLLRVWGPTNADYNAHNKWGASFRYESTTISESIVESLYNGQAIGPAQMGNPYDSAVVASDLGAWVQWRFHGKAATDSTSSDAVVQMWKNGALIHDVTGLDALVDQGDGLGRLWGAGYFLGYANSGFDSNTYIWIDDLKMYASDPGW
jgi:hypothetical protein